MKKTRKGRQPERDGKGPRAKRTKRGGQTKGASQTKRVARSGRTKLTAEIRGTGRSTQEKPRPRPLEPQDFLTSSIETAHAGAAPAGEPAGKRGLGERIREARKMRGLTLEDLSSRSGIPVDTLEQVETNRAIPPLGELIRLGKALEMKMGYFISEGTDRPMSVVRSESRRTVARRGTEASERYGYVYESLAPEKANRLMEPFLVTLAPTEFGELSSHDGQEFIFVLEGEVRVQVGKETEVLRPGDSAYYDSFHPHLVKCHRDRPAKILAVIHAGARPHMSNRL